MNLREIFEKAAKGSAQSGKAGGKKQSVKSIEFS
jgi:hypothetical protein